MPDSWASRRQVSTSTNVPDLQWGTKRKYPKIHSTISKVCPGLINRLTFRFLQSNGQQLVPLRMPSYLNRVRRLTGSIFICNKMSSTRAAYQGTEERCQGRWGPQSLARWCNGSAKPLSPPLYPGGLTWPKRNLRVNFINVLDRPESADIVVVPWHKVDVGDG